MYERGSPHLRVFHRGFTLKEPTMDAFCSQCNSPISCNPGNDCWCSTLPHTLPVPDPETTGCLCRTCLTRKQELREAAVEKGRQ